MLNNPDAEAMIQDARESQAAAVLEVTGTHNANGTGITGGIKKLARERGGEWTRLKDDYGLVVRFLHGQAFYKGIYSEDVGDRVRGAADYIRRAEQLARE